jgi:hypothetical protein
MERSPSIADPRQEKQILIICDEELKPPLEFGEECLVWSAGEVHRGYSYFWLCPREEVAELARQRDGKNGEISILAPTLLHACMRFWLKGELQIQLGLGEEDEQYGKARSSRDL